MRDWRGNRREHSATLCPLQPIPASRHTTPPETNPGQRETCQLHLVTSAIRPPGLAPIRQLTEYFQLSVLKLMNYLLNQVGLSSSEGPNPSNRCFVLFFKSLISPCTKKNKPMHHVVSFGDMQPTPLPSANKSPGRAAHLYRELEIYFIPRGLHLSTKRRKLKGKKKKKTSLSFASEISGSDLYTGFPLVAPNLSASGQVSGHLLRANQEPSCARCPPGVPTSVSAMHDE